MYNQYFIFKYTTITANIYSSEVIWDIESCAGLDLESEANRGGAM